MVSCEYEDKVQIRMRDTVSEWWVTMIPLNYNVAVKNGELSRDRETWVALERNVNAFIYKAGDQALATPFYVRLTGINDQVAMFTFNDITPNKVYDADIQFTVPANQYFDVVSLEPVQKPSDAPECCQLVDEWTVIYDDAIRGKWQDASHRIKANYASTNNPAQGEHCVRADMEGWGLLQILTSDVAAPLTVYKNLTFKYRADFTDEQALNLRLQDHDPSVILPTVAGKWMTASVDLATYIGTERFHAFFMQNRNPEPRTFYFDDIRLTKHETYPGSECGLPYDPYLHSAALAPFVLAVVLLGVLL